jgi:hypothetical protein
LDHDLRSHPSFYVNLIAEGELVVRQELRKNGMLIDIWRVRDGYAAGALGLVAAGRRLLAPLRFLIRIRSSASHYWGQLTLTTIAKKISVRRDPASAAGGQAL